jgi:hypothetical protein
MSPLKFVNGSTASEALLADSGSENCVISAAGGATTRPKYHHAPPVPSATRSAAAARATVGRQLHTITPANLDAATGAETT